MFISTDNRNLLKLWDTSRLVPVMQFNTVPGGGNVARFCPNPMTIAIGTRSGVVFCDLRIPSCSSKIDRYSKYIRCLEWSNEFEIVCLDDSGVVTEFDTRNSKQKRIISSSLLFTDMDKSDAFLMLAGSEGHFVNCSVQIYDIKSFSLVTQFPTYPVFPNTEIHCTSKNIYLPNRNCIDTYCIRNGIHSSHEVSGGAAKILENFSTNEIYVLPFDHGIRILESIPR